jgi:hypothetical protein
VTADIGQQQLLFTFFQFFDRTPISRDGDCYGLVEISKISGEGQVFGLCQRFDNFEYGGPVQTASTVREKSPAIKAGHWGTIRHLETTCMPFNINKEENVLISGTREKSAVADSAEPKTVRQFFSRSANFCCGAKNSEDA